METEKQKQQLLNDLDRAFPVTPKPAVLAGRQPCGGDEYTYVDEFFRDRPWSEITLEDLWDTYPGPPDACLSFMSAEAFQYYLPSYLSIFLRHWDRADTIADAAIFALVPTSDEKLRVWQAERFRQFTSSQRKVIADFLSYVDKKYRDYYEFFGLADALLYWQAAAREAYTAGSLT